MTAALLRALAALGEAVGVVETLAPQMLRAERLRLEDTALSWRDALAGVVAEQSAPVEALRYASPAEACAPWGDGAADLHEVTANLP